MDTHQKYQAIESLLKKLKIFSRSLAILSAILKWVVSILPVLCLILFLDQQLPIPRIFRMAMMLAFFVFVGYQAFLSFKPVLKKITLSTAAFWVGQAYPEQNDHVLSATQLYPLKSGNSLHYSTDLVDRIVEYAQSFLSKISLNHVLSSEIKAIQKYSIYAFLLLVCLTLELILFPNSFAEFVTVFEADDRTPLISPKIEISQISPGDSEIQSGESVNFRAVVNYSGTGVTLQYRRLEGAWQEHPMNKINSYYQTTIQHITTPLEYYVQVNETQTPKYRLKVTRQPRVHEFQLALKYPPYTQRASEKLEINQGDLQVLVGTEVSITGKVSSNVTLARLVFDTDEKLDLELSPDFDFSGFFIVQRSDQYHIALEEFNGLTNQNSISYQIKAINDQRPRIQILKPGTDTVLDDTMLVRLRISVQDDFGVQSLRLVYYIEGTDISSTTPKTSQLTLVEFASPETDTIFNYDWDLDLLRLFPEDVVVYHLEARDNDSISGPNVGNSQTFTIRFPSLAEILGEVESEQQAGIQSLEAIFEQQVAAEQAVDELIDRLRKSQDLSQTDEKVLKETLGKQKQIEKTVKQELEEMKLLTEHMKKQQLFDAETVAKYQELQDLMQQALSEEHKELLRQLSQAIEQQDLKKQEQELTEANFNQEQFMQKLDRMKALYQQMLLQQKLEAAVKRAEDLKNQQIHINSKLAKEQTESSQRIAQQEERIFSGTRDLLTDIGKLGQEMIDQAQVSQQQLSQVGNELQRLKKFAQSNQLTATLQKMVKQLQKGEKNAETAQSVEQTLTELYQGLDNALEFLQGANSEKTLAELRSAVRSTLYLSQKHQLVWEKTKSILMIGKGRYLKGEISQLQRLAATEIGLANGTDTLASRLWELGKQQMQIKPELIWGLETASDAFKRSAKALEDRQPSLASPIQKQGLEKLNQVTLALLDAMNQMNMQMGAGSMENMMEQLQQLTQNQEKLNEMAQQLSQQMRQKGKLPGHQEMIQRMAYEQQMIREATERLAKMAEQMKQLLGDLEGISEEMKTVESELKSQNLTREVLDKQKQILTRMLESTKSLQKREEGKKRKGEVAKATLVKPQISPLDPELLQKITEVQQGLKSVDFQQIPIQYRQQLKDYFRVLSQQPSIAP